MPPLGLSGGQLAQGMPPPLPGNESDRLPSRLDAKLLKDVSQVRLDRPLSDPEPTTVHNTLALGQDRDHRACLAIPPLPSIPVRSGYIAMAKMS